MQLVVALLIALICGILSIVVIFGLVSTFSQNQETIRQQAAEEVETLKTQLDRLKSQSEAAMQKQATVVVASDTLTQGVPITSNLMELQTVAVSDVPPGAFQSLDAVVGRVANQTIPAGAALTAANLTKPSSVYELPAGYRAMAIAVDSVGGLGGEIQPGVYVDVMTTLEGGKDLPPVSRTLLQRARVLNIAADTGHKTGNSGGMASFSGSAGGGKSGPPASQYLVTLAVRPAEAEKLALAQQLGTFHLALRSFQDQSTMALPGSQFHQLSGGPSPQTSASKAAKANNAAPHTKAAPPRAPSLPSFQSLMGQQYPAASSAHLPPSMPYQMEIVKGANSETVTLQAQ